MNEQTLFRWHELLMLGHPEVDEVGKFRTHNESMQIVSSRENCNRVFFEAPPSDRLIKEMNGFIDKFNSDSDQGILEQVAILHLLFENIHPFEDGNGRVGRALVEKKLSQRLGRPALIPVSRVIRRKRQEYYGELGKCNRSLDATHWVLFFARVVIEAQQEATQLIDFLMMKAQLMNRLSGELNKRQEKALLRMFAEGPNGFDGGLCAKNYMAITKTTPSTASRDLADLVVKGALYKTGEKRYTRYWLCMPS